MTEFNNTYFRGYFNFYDRLAILLIVLSFVNQINQWMISVKT